MKRIDVLDEGYVALQEAFGSDLTVVNAARVSFNKKKEELDDKDIRLIRFLAREGHTSPFRHAFLQFEVYAPLMVARQWWKYVVGGDHIMDAWNESSRRYVTEDNVFYVPGPGQWRSKTENKKQGSGPPVDVAIGEKHWYRLLHHIDTSLFYYEEALKDGICPEQARLFLPAYGLYVRWYWTGSLQSVCHFLNQRLGEDAQEEIQEYAKAVYRLAVEAFPVSVRELVIPEVRETLEEGM